MVNTPSPHPDDQVSAYSFHLRPESIAQHPSERRGESRLLVVRREEGDVEHARFRDLPRFLSPNDLLVANDTRVLAARLHGNKQGTGGAVEVLALHPLGNNDTWAALVRPSAKVKPGTQVDLRRRTDQEVIATLTVGGFLDEGQREVVGITHELLELVGEMPLPPYIDRELTPADRERYQTVYARERGAVAAPTAGLHFTLEVLTDLQARGIDFGRVTLHVGAGTFQPVRTARLSDHPMHSERFTVSAEVAQQVADCQARGGRLVAVGTTSCRSLETWHRIGQPIDGGERESSLFLHPSDPPQLPMSLLTNFHLPQSTLLMLVSAFLGRQRTLRLYETAQQEGYRFYSYGDAMLIL